MELISLICPNCGCRELGKIKLNGDFGVCPACNESFVMKRAKELAKVEVDKTNDIKALRENLSKEITINDVRAIKRTASELLEIIPTDVSAAYFYAYAENEMDNHLYLDRFYCDNSLEYTPEEVITIIEHIIEHSDLRDEHIVTKYIASRNGIDAEQYVRHFKMRFEERCRQEELYDNIPRDVFICHRSTDEIIAKKVCEELENDGNVCWISSRNLRPNDTENYWVNIQRAIESCKIFLVVSSREAMLSKDVKREIEYAKELNKPRLECKIDDVEHTTFFKMFFDGITWIDMQRLDETSISDLKWRVYSILQPNTKYKPQAKAIGDADWNVKSNLSKARHNVKQRKYDEDAFDFNVEEPTMPLAEAQPKYDVSCFGFEMESGKSNNWFDQEIVIDGMEEWIGKGVRITAYNKKNSDVVVIPSEIEGYPVVSIGKEVFAKSRISEIVLPNTIRALLKSAFEDCRNLKKITLPEGLIHIGDNCFNGSGLMEIEIPNSVRELPMFCFANCDIRKAQVGTSVRKIGQLAFGRNPIASIKLSEGVEVLDGNCLSATRLSGVVIPRSVKEIHPVAFANIDNPQAPARVTLAVLGMETTVPEHDQFKTLIGVRMVYCMPGSKIEKYAKEHFVMTKPLDDLKK